MSEKEKSKIWGGTILKWLFAAAFVAAVVLSGLFSGLMDKAGLFYLLSGSVAAALMGFSPREIGAAFRHAAGKAGNRTDLKSAAYFWEAAARNAWVLGVLGSALNVVIALGVVSGGIADISNRLIQSFIVTLYGLVLAAVCLVPAMKVRAGVEKAPASGPAQSGPFRAGYFGKAAGYVLFAAVLGLTIFSLLKGQPQSGTMFPAKVIFHGPAFLVVFGGAVALALFMGSGAGARALTLGFAMAGLIGLLMGFIQALLGFVHTSVQDISAAIAFVISVSLYGLLGLVVVAAPLEDREVMEGRRDDAGPLSRMAWVLLPFLAFLFLILTFFMVITPMKR